MGKAPQYEYTEREARERHLRQLREDHLFSLVLELVRLPREARAQADMPSLKHLLDDLGIKAWAPWEPPPTPSNG